MIKEAGRNPSAKATLQRTVDLIVFEMGLAAYKEWLLSVGQDPASDGHALKAELLMVRYRDPIKDMFESHLQQFTELPSGGLLQRTYRQASRAGNIKERFDSRVEFYKRFARWGMAHRQDINDVFKRKSRRIMREVLQVADDEQPALVVNKLASLQTVSGLNQTRNWLKKAAVLCGEEVDPVTEAVADTESAKTVAEEVRDLDRKIAVADPVSDEAADLAFEREDAINTLNETVESAKDSEAALTNAVDVITNSDLPSWVSEYGLNDEQMRVLLADGKLIVNAGAGSGKAQPHDAKILTPSGWKLMGDIQVGDIVMAHDGSRSEVLGVYPQGLKNIYRVTFHDGSSTECCGEHLWQVENTRKARKERKTKVLDLDTIKDHMSRYSRVQYAVPTVKSLNFDQEDLSLDPYLLGALLGDGYLGSERGTGFRFSTTDEYLVTKVRSLLEDMNCVLRPHGICDHLIQMDDSIQMQGHKVVHPLRLALDELGLTGLRSGEKFIPESYLWGSEESRLAILQGLMDTDGTVSKKGKSVTFTTVSPRLKEDFKHLVQSLGGTCQESERRTSYTHKGEKRAGALSYRITVKLPNGMNPFSLPRKAERVQPREKYLTQRIIKSVEPVGKKEAQCIAIDHPDHLYVTDDFIVTHNTHTLVAKIGYAVRELGMTPDQILAVSFTKLSSEELKERVERKFGIKEQSIGQTMNSLSFNALLREGTRAEALRVRNFDIGKKSILENYAYRQLSLSTGDEGDKPYYSEKKQQWVEPNPSFRYQKRGLGIDAPELAWIHEVELPKDGSGKPVSNKVLLNMLGKWKAQGLLNDDIVRLYKDSEIPEERCAAALSAAYTWLKENDVRGPMFDFNDMQIRFRDKLRDDDRFRARYQAKFKMVLVDEAQDTNAVQHEIFDTLGEKSDILAYIGDDRQCVEVNTPVMTPVGDVPAKDLQVGQEVFSYRNGQIVPQKVTHLAKSSWDWGYKVTTESGKTLTMSPNHKIWASDPVLSEEEHMVYLMYRQDMGYRVGVTSTDSRDVNNSWGSRPHHERAERLWVLDICPTKEDALYRESELSLTYGIPTQVFEAESRGINPERIAKVFEAFGNNGAVALEDHNLRFDLPHWMSGSYSKHGIERRTIRMNAHASSNTQVTLEWTGEDLDHLKASEKVSHGKNNRIRRWFSSYQEGLEYAQELQAKTGANLCRRLSTPEGMINLMTASGLHKGMSVAVASSIEDGIVLDRIEKVEKVQGEFLDLQVDDASNFFGDGILSHNSIYKFRGADPKLYIDKARSDFRELRMELNYRSGSNIVNAGENLIAYNGDRQLPKTCRAVESSGEGRIVYTQPDTHQTAAKDVVSEIRSKLKTGEYEPRDFGIVTRTNAEKDAFIVALIAAGIPFETKGGFNFFGKDIVKGVIAWTRIAVERGDKANLALKHVLKTPNFKLLGDKFVWKAKAMAKKAGYTDICEYLATEDPLVYKAGVDSQLSVEALGVAIRELRAMGTNSFPALLERILTLKGTDDMGGGPMSFLDQLVSKMNLDELQEKGEISSSNITREELEEIAKAPLNPLLSIAEARPGVEAFLNTVDILTGKEATAKSKEDEVRKTGRVNVNTCHQWKGLEAQELFVLMAGGVWPHSRSEDLDEERRLAYVGITRGKQSVKVLAPQINYRNQPAKKSPFIGEACIRSEDEDFLTRQSSIRFAEFVEENPFGNFIVDMVLDLGEEE